MHSQTVIGTYFHFGILVSTIDNMVSKYYIFIKISNTNIDQKASNKSVLPIVLPDHGNKVGDKSN